MSITTYTELQTAIGNWLERGDLAARAPEFIALAEARFRRELREWLRGTITATAVTGDYTVSATVDAVIGVAYNDGVGGVYNHPLDILTWTAYHERLAGDSTVRAPVQAVYIERNEVADTTILRFYPPVSASSPIDNLSIEVAGYLPALSAGQPTNRLLAVAPDLYLFGSLAESAPYLMHDERLAMWEQRLVQGVQALRMQTDRRRLGGIPQPRRLPVVFGERV